MQEVVSELGHLKLGCAGHPASFVIQGGYFESVRGFDAFARASLERALELGGLLRKLNPQNQVIYDLLVNDLGISCSGSVCDIANPSTDGVPADVAWEEAHAFAQTRGVELTSTTERYMRNWGFRRLKKILKTDRWGEKHPRLHSKAVGDRLQWQLKSRSGDDILLFEESGLSWIAKCPVIMGAYYAFMLGRAGNEGMAMSKVVIDLCSPTDRDKVSKGAETTFTLFRPQQRRQDLVMPVLCDATCQTMLPLSLLAMDLA